MRVVGITLVRNEADIVGVTTAHHLALGCDRVLVLDNGSTDGTTAVLADLARTTGRVSWSVDAGPYRQSELLSGLAREAARLGADWVLPFDADEFWWPAAGGLAGVLAGAGAGVGGLVAPVRNFVQRREQRRSHPTALLTMTRRVAFPVGPPVRCPQLVSSGAIAFVEMEYPPKLVLRPSDGMVVHEGNHSASGLPGPLAPTAGLLCLHAPLRSRERLDRRREDGARVEEAFPQGLGWHARRWGRLVADGDLDREWAANSYDRAGCLDVAGRPHRMAYDPTLRDALAGTVRRFRPALRRRSA